MTTDSGKKLCEYFCDQCGDCMDCYGDQDCIDGGFHSCKKMSKPTLCANCEQLQKKLDKACDALEDICHDQHLIGLDHQMAIWMFNRASDALEEIRKKDDNG